MSKTKNDKKKALVLGVAIGAGVVVGAGVAAYLHKKSALRVVKDMVAITNAGEDWLLVWKPTEYGKEVDLSVIIEQLQKHVF